MSGKLAIVLMALLAVSMMLTAFSIRPVKAAGGKLWIINPGPQSKPDKWNATSFNETLIGTNSSMFYAPGTAVNQTFFVNITVTDVQLLYAWGIGIVYDNTTIQYVFDWRPSDHVFKPVQDMSWSLVPTKSIDPVNNTHAIAKLGLTYIIPDGAEPWSFNGTGQLCQIQFKIVKAVSETTPQVTSLITWNATAPELWTTLYYYPSGTAVPPVESYSFTYTYDGNPPIIGTPTRTPTTVDQGQTVFVTVNVTDVGVGVKNVTLMFTNDTATWYNIAMTYNSTTLFYEGTIPGHTGGIQIKYKIDAYDYAGNHAVNDNATLYFVYTVIPEFPRYSMLAIFMLVTTIIVLVTMSRSKRIKKLGALGGSDSRRL